MTDRVRAWPVYTHISGPQGTIRIGENDCDTEVRLPELMNSDERPSWVTYLRIWEAAPTLRDPTAIEVLKDALEVGNMDSVDTVIKSIGIVGMWRPSTIIVARLWDIASDRIVAEQVVAHSLWNTRLAIPWARGYGLAMNLLSDERRPRLLRIQVHTTDMTDEELNRR